MKQIITFAKDNKIEYIITEEGRPLCRGTYFTDAANVGDIIEGRVTDLKPDIDGCFVDIDAERTAFLNMQKLNLRKGNYYGFYIHGKPSGSKGAFLSAKLPFTGIYNAIVLIPENSCKASDTKNNEDTLRHEVKISRKIVDEQIRAELTAAASECIKGRYTEGRNREGRFPEGCRVLVTVRTAAAENKKAAADELAALVEAVGSISAPSGSNRPGRLLYKRSFPEFLTELYPYRDYESVSANDPAVGRELYEYYKKRDIDVAVKLLPADVNPCETDSAARKVLCFSGRVMRLPHGGTVIYDRTEAMHVFDVNSGGSKLSYTDVNLEACESIAAHIKVNNLTGIIIVDFISVKSPADRDAILSRMRGLLEDDYALTIIEGFTRLQLLEISRSRKLI